MDHISNRHVNGPMALVLGADDNYAMPMGVVLHSILRHLEAGYPAHVYVVDGGISEVSKRRLARVVDMSQAAARLEWVAPDVSLLRDLKVFGHVSAATYFSLLIPELVGGQYDRAIHLDCDLLVEADLRRLWEQDLDGHAALAVRDFLVPSVSSPGGIVSYAELGLRADLPYFNAGVMVFNLRRWRAEDISHKALRYLHEFADRLNFRDQEGLNVALAGEWGTLHPKWNVQSAIFEHEQWVESGFKEEIGSMRDELLQGPHIYHFTGGRKPWHLQSGHPAKVQWRRYLAESRWFEPLGGSRMRREGRRSVTSVEAPPRKTETKVTVAIPTYNRAEFLGNALESVLKQDYSDLHVLVLDDASQDDTGEVVKAFSRPRLTYVRNETNVGLIGNWNRAVALNNSPYLAILSDDDVILPGFVRRCAEALDAHRQAAFAAGLVRYVDVEGKVLHVQEPGDGPAGPISGLNYLERLVTEPAWTTHPAAVMLRASALDAVDPFQAPHSKQLFDVNLYIRLAARFDVVLIPEVLAEVRLHSEQTRAAEFRAVEGSEPLARMAELTDAVGYLLRSERAVDPVYREWLAERLLALNGQRGALTRFLVPNLQLDWTDQLKAGLHDALPLIPPGERFILVNEAMWQPESFAGRQAVPFPEHNALYSGHPPDSDTAIRELEQMRREGIGFIVFAWPSFWWFDHYVRFRDYLRAAYRCVLENDRVVTFDLR